MTKHATFSVLFVPRAKRNEKQTSEKLYARITVGGQRVETSLGRDISAGLFDTKAQRCLGNSKEAKQVNDFLNLVYSNLNEIRKELILENKVVSAERIKARYKGQPDPDQIQFPKVLELYEEHNRKFKELIGTKNHSVATYQRHLTSIGHVQNFIRYNYKKEDLELEQVNFSFLNDYEHYLKSVRKCNHNSTMKYIKNLGKIIRLAIAEGYMTANPFDKFKLTYDPVHRVILTQDEVNNMVKLKIPEARLDRVRDMFVFCTYTGIAFIDAQKLKKEHIYKDNEGTKWIKNTRIKTNTEFMVPILKVPKKIIKKYKNHPDRQEKGLVIPKISNQNYNAYLKELALRCNISKNLTSHIARHTFATTIMLENSVPIETVSKMLGHSSIKTTQIYAKVHEKAIKSGINNLLKGEKKKSKKKKKNKKGEKGRKDY